MIIGSLSGKHRTSINKNQELKRIQIQSGLPLPCDSALDFQTRTRTFLKRMKAMKEHFKRGLSG